MLRPFSRHELIGSHKPNQVIYATRVNKLRLSIALRVSMTPLAAGFAAKGQIILMTGSPNATGLAHSILFIWFDHTLTRGAMLRSI